jgi:hypothetical protein
MPAPGLEQVESAQSLISRGPVTFVAAFFAIAFGWLLFIHLRSKDRHAAQLATAAKEHAEELAKVNRERLEHAVRVEATLTHFLAVVEAMPRARRTTRARKKAEGLGEDTVRVVIPREGTDD